MAVSEQAEAMARGQTYIGKEKNYIESHIIWIDEQYKKVYKENILNESNFQVARRKTNLSNLIFKLYFERF